MASPHKIDDFKEWEKLGELSRQLHTLCVQVACLAGNLMSAKDSEQIHKAEINISKFKNHADDVLCTKLIKGQLKNAPDLNSQRAMSVFYGSKE